jgi:hypothetical protein
MHPMQQVMLTQAFMQLNIQDHCHFLLEGYDNINIIDDYHIWTIMFD